MPTGVLVAVLHGQFFRTAVSLFESVIMLAWPGDILVVSGATRKIEAFASSRQR
ncbi:MAG: hypothetical protein ABW049_14390 [Spongiibacteraceae bacterium]